MFKKAAEIAMNERDVMDLELSSGWVSQASAKATAEVFILLERWSWSSCTSQYVTHSQFKKHEDVDDRCCWWAI